MTLPNDKGIIFYPNGFVRTHDKNGKLIEPTYEYKNFPRPSKSGDSDKSTDKATSSINVNINVVIKTH